jgi:trigger factor
MHVTTESISDTKRKLIIAADQPLLDDVKRETLEHLAKDHVKIQGFRQGKAPLNLVEKNVEPSLLQSEFLERAVNRLYVAAANHEKLRPVDQPTVNITKFVPFTALEISAEVEVVGDVTLPDYKKIKLARSEVKMDAKDVESVLHDLRTRLGEKKEVKAAAKDGNEVIIDFKGTDTKTKESIQGADGKDYPLILGSDSFIPGFEDELVGLKAGDDTTFDITFPKDYSVKALQSRKVTFTVHVSKVQSIELPPADDKLASRVGPFKTLAELKADIKKQMQAERQNQLDRDYEGQLLEKIAQQTKVAIPDSLIDEEVERQLNQTRQNLAYRGQTWQEFLEAEGQTEDKYRQAQRPEAELRVRAGLALSEIADQEHVTVTPDEVDVRLQLLKGQYQDPAMQAELDKPETRRELTSRILSEKTIAKLAAYASK